MGTFDLVQEQEREKEESPLVCEGVAVDEVREAGEVVKGKG